MPRPSYSYPVLVPGAGRRLLNPHWPHWYLSSGLFPVSISRNKNPAFSPFHSPLYVGFFGSRRAGHFSTRFLKLPACFSAPTLPFIVMPLLPSRSLVLWVVLVWGLWVGRIGLCYCILLVDDEFPEEGDCPRSGEGRGRVALFSGAEAALELSEVHEEVQKSLSRCVHVDSRPLSDKIQLPITTRWRLSFRSKLSNTLFTGSRIESQERMPVTVVIENSNCGTIIESGPLSSVRVEIVVIDDDFCGDEQKDWTEREFADNVVLARDGKRPLLTGDLVATLTGGIGNFYDLTFTDNSSWRRTRKFRLGARILPSNCTVERIKEAISGAFSVKDHRGELYKKHHPPSLHDHVWRLEKIGKDGAFHKRLSENGIKTVQEFLKFLVMDENQLRNILGSGMSNRTWEVITGHAQKCVLDDKLYSYHIAENQVMIIFDSIFRVVWVKFDGSDYQHVSCLPGSQMFLVHRLKQIAYKNWNDITEIGPPSVDNFPRHLIIADASALVSTLQCPQNPGFPTAVQDVQIAQAGPEHSLSSPLHSEPPEDPCQLNCISTGEETTQVQLCPSALLDGFYMGDSLGRSPVHYGAEASRSRPGQ